MSERVQDRFVEAARARPGARAVVEPEITMTYGDLDEESDRLSALLLGVGCRRGDGVVVLAPRGARGTVATLAVLKAGCVCIPLDPARRRVRAAEIIRRAGPCMVLVGDCERDLLEDLGARGALRGVRVGWLGPGPAPALADLGPEDLRDEAAPAAAEGAEPEDPAFVLFGRSEDTPPRGVIVTHAALGAFVDWAVHAFGLGPDDRVGGWAGPESRMCGLETWAALAAGAEVHPATGPARAGARGLPDFLEARRITLWSSPPAPLVRAGASGAGRPLEALRHVVWSGDVLPTPCLSRWRALAPRAAFTNLYGCAEGTTATCHYRVPAALEDPLAGLPIGTPRPGQELLVLDEDLEPVPDGVVGDLYLRGPGVSPGYWRNGGSIDPVGEPGDFFVRSGEGSGTARLFRTGDRGYRGSDGLFRFVGRSAFRIAAAHGEAWPTQIEQALLQLEEVSACTVVPVTAPDRSTSMVGCAYVPSDGSVLRTRDLRRRLAGILADGEIPARWLVLEELPVDGRGIVDRGLARTLLGG